MTAVAMPPAEWLRERADQLRKRLEREVATFEGRLSLSHERLLRAQSELDIQAENAAGGDLRDVPTGQADDTATIDRPVGEPLPGASPWASSPTGHSDTTTWAVASPPGTVADDVDWNQLVRIITTLIDCDGVQLSSTGVHVWFTRRPTPTDVRVVEGSWLLSGGPGVRWEVRRA